MVAVGAKKLLGTAKRIVVKVGSSLIVSKEGVRRDWLESIATDVGSIRSEGREVIIVSSGAVALGRFSLGMDRSPRLDLKQAAAAVGQPQLMNAWSACLASHGLITGQMLLTLQDTESRGRWLNARATIDTLLTRGAVPIINENDSVATDEIRYGDNDRLSARVAQLAGADLLILLSDVDGLYNGDPTHMPTVRHIAFVAEVDERIESMAGVSARNGIGTGGMQTKLEAARIASQSGCTTLIASGFKSRPLHAMANGALATEFAPQGSPGRAYKHWIAGSLKVAGIVRIDDGAVTALRAGGSLLPAGARAIEGDFSQGACVAVCNDDQSPVARGIIRYSADEARAICGCRSEGIAARLGYTRGDELVHRDDLVMS